LTDRAPLRRDRWSALRRLLFALAMLAAIVVLCAGLVVGSNPLALAGAVALAAMRVAALLVGTPEADTSAATPVVSPALGALAGDLSDMASMRSRRRDVAGMALTPGLFGLLAFGLSFETGSLALLAVTVLVLLPATAAMVIRSRQMRFAVAPDGLTVVNFWRSRSIPWKEVAVVEMADPPWSLGLGVAAAITGEDTDSGRGIGIRVRKEFANPVVLPTVVASVTVGRDPLRDPALRDVVAVLHKQAAAQGVPVAIPLTRG
jgi:hypothetical protein